MTDKIGPVIASRSDEVWYTRCPIPTTFGLALKWGLADKAFPPTQGRVQWHSLQRSDDKATQLSHFTHTKERSFRHGGNIPAIWARSEGADTRLIGISWQPTPYRILVLSESKIESPADLKGKRLLLPHRPAAKIDFWQAVNLRIYEKALASVGLSFADVTLVRRESQRGDTVRLDPSKVDARSPLPLQIALGFQRDALFPLLRGEVDAVAHQGHDAVQLAALVGAETIFDQSDSRNPLDRINNDTPDVLAVSGRFLDQEPELVAEFVAGLLEAHAWANAHRAEAETLLARELNISEQVLRIAYGDIVPGFHLDFLEEKLAGVAGQKEFLLRHGFIARDFNLDDWIDRRPLQRAHEILAARQSAAA